MGLDCWQEKSFPTQPTQKYFRMLHLLRLAKLNTSVLVLKVSCTYSALWNSFFKTREWFQKVSLYCVSFQKVSLVEVGLKFVALSVWQPSLPPGGFLGVPGALPPPSPAPLPSSPFTLLCSCLILCHHKYTRIGKKANSPYKKGHKAIKWPSPVCNL